MEKDYLALLTIPVMPKSIKDKQRLVAWLRQSAKEIKKADSDEYSKPCKFRLMK